MRRMRRRSRRRSPTRPQARSRRCDTATRIEPKISPDGGGVPSVHADREYIQIRAWTLRLAGRDGPVQIHRSARRTSEHGVDDRCQHLAVPFSHPVDARSRPNRSIGRKPLMWIAHCDQSHRRAIANSDRFRPHQSRRIGRKECLVRVAQYSAPRSGCTCCVRAAQSVGRGARRYVRHKRGGRT